MDKKHRIKELIKEKGYTQEEFAELLGMSRNGLYCHVLLQDWILMIKV